MILMALDHAGYFLQKLHFRGSCKIAFFKSLNIGSKS